MLKKVCYIVKLVQSGIAGDQNFFQIGQVSALYKVQTLVKFSIIYYHHHPG